MRFLVRMTATKVQKEDLLQAVKTIARTFGVDPRNPKWTSYGALELDIFSPTRADFDLFITAVEPLAEFEFAKDLSTVPAYKLEDELFAEARELFNTERYWECHEVLESVWRTKQGDDKRLLQGIILVCAGFVHHQKGEAKVALGVFRRSVPLLDYQGDYGGFKVSRLRKNVEKLIQTGRVANFKL
jgi:uncharacterized protein